MKMKTVGVAMQVWAISVSVILFTLVVVAGYFYFFDTPIPMTLNNVPFPVQPTIVVPGESVRPLVDYCIFTPLPITRHVILVNVATNDIRVLQTVVGAGGKDNIGCGKILVAPIPIPPDSQHGIYYVQGDFSFTINPLRTRRVTWTTERFEVK